LCTARGLSERAVLGGLLHASQNGVAAWGTHLARLDDSVQLTDGDTATAVFEYIYEYQLQSEIWY
jgi:hypothetical protein